MSQSNRLCENCGNGEGKFRCGSCRVAFYCSKECQIGHWAKHKPDCKPIEPQTPGEWLKQLKVKPIDKVSSVNPSLFSPTSNLYVSDGDSKISNDRLFTFAVTTCVVVAIFGEADGKRIVLLQHSSGWNGKGNRYEHNTRLMKDLLPKTFKFTCGYIIPGAELDNKLFWSNPSASVNAKGESIQQELLWENLAGMPWKNQLILLSGLSRWHFIDLSVDKGVQIYSLVAENLISNAQAQQREVQYQKDWSDSMKNLKIK